MSWPRQGHYPPNHKGLIRYVADRTGLSYRVAREAVTATVDFLLLKVMDEDGRVEVARLGSFYKHLFPGRKWADGSWRTMPQYRMGFKAGLSAREGGRYVERGGY